MECSARTSWIGHLGNIVDRHRILSFFVGTFSFSWTFWIGIAVSTDAQSLGLIAVVPGAFGPPLAALAVVWLTGDDVRNWLQTVGRIHASLRWYGIALMVPVAMVTVGTIVLAVLGVDLAVGELPLRITIFLPTVLFMALLGGGQEELGWRGFVLPRLERRFRPWSAAIALGIIWAVWHLPLFYLPGASQFGRSFTIYGINVIGLSVLFTWLYNKSASVAVVTVLHGSYNAAVMLYPVPIDQLNDSIAGSNVLIVGTATAWLAALMVIVLTHGDLGYHSLQTDSDDSRTSDYL